MDDKVCEAQRFLNEGGSSLQGDDLVNALERAGATIEGSVFIFRDGSRGHRFPAEDGSFVPTHDCDGKSLEL